MRNLPLALAVLVLTSAGPSEDQWYDFTSGANNDVIDVGGVFNQAADGKGVGGNANASPVRAQPPDYDALAAAATCVPSEWLPFMTVDLHDIGKALCAPRELPADVLTAMSATVSTAQFLQLPITPSPVSVQPPNGWAFVNMDTFVYTDAAPQILPTTVLGFDVEVEATPVRFMIDFGDGSAPVVTDDPGAPWPDATIAHAYAQPGQATITVTTTWSGRFRVVGYTGWRPVLGYATTTSSAPPLDLLEAHAHLVSGPES